MADHRIPLSPDALKLEPNGLASYPPVEKWDDWVEYDTAQWPRKVEKHCQIIPTICFNCEAACGLVGVVEKDTNRIRRFEGNPEHPGSRGRNCAKGPATLNQVTDPERIRYPLKRIGRRGEGKWERVSWDEVLDDIAGRVRKALQEERRNEIMYHVGRPGHELLYHQRILHSWGIDGHNSHTNVCSAGARAGYAFWSGIDRPSPDHANARFILLLSSHLETGHYFNPHAQRIIEAKEHGARKLVEGLAPGESLSGRRVAVLEDVTTTGGSATKAIEALTAEGAVIERVITVVDRLEGAELPYHRHNSRGFYCPVDSGLS